VTGPDIEALRERFLAYAEAFATREPGQEAHYRLKIEHSLRVLGLAQEIARQERLAPDTAELTAMAALFHDTGRFPPASGSTGPSATSSRRTTPGSGCRPCWRTACWRAWSRPSAG